MFKKLKLIIKILFEEARRFTFILKGGEEIMGRLHPLNGPTFPRLEIILRIVICRFDIKSRLKRGTNVLWKVYEKDAFSTVVKVSKGSNLNRNRLISNFSEHPRF